MPGLLLQKPASAPTGLRVKKWFGKLRFLKRLSPFLLAALFLPVLFSYWFFKEESLSQKFILCLAFLFVEANLAYLDMALWKYYKGKKLVRIWTIELMSLLAIAMLCFNVLFPA